MPIKKQNGVNIFFRFACWLRYKILMEVPYFKFVFPNYKIKTLSKLELQMCN